MAEPALSAVNNFKAGDHRMTDDEKSHGYRVKRVMAGDQQTNQHQTHKHTDMETRAFFQITQLHDRFMIEMFAFVDQG